MKHAITVEEIVDDNTAEVLFVKDDEHTLAVVDFDVAADGEVTITIAAVLLFGEGFDAYNHMSVKVEQEICAVIAEALS